MISDVFAGRMTALKRYEGEHLPQVIEALVEALEGYFTGTNAARALAEVHAVEALPRLRKVLRRAEGSDHEAVSLPRAAREPGPETGDPAARSWTLGVAGLRRRTSGHNG